MRYAMYCLVAMLLAAGGDAAAQAFPTKPLRLLLTFSSGGQADVLARLVTDKMGHSLGQPIVVEPRPGAGGNIAMEAAAKSAKDGYTLVFGTPAVAINGTLYRDLSYDPLADLVPISLAAWGPYALYVTATLPLGSAADLIAYAKAHPGKLNYASVGVGSGTHLAAVLFSLAAGVEMVHVPYKGIQQAAPDMATGQVHLTFNAIGPLGSFVESGAIKLIATSGPRRLAQYPDLPTLGETLPGFDVAGWYGFFAAAGTPRPILERLNAEIVKAVRDPEVSARIEKIGLQPSPQTLDEAALFVKREAEKWSRAVKASGATAE